MKRWQRITKKWVAMLLTLTMCMSLFSAPAFADGESFDASAEQVVETSSDVTDISPDPTPAPDSTEPPAPSTDTPVSTDDETPAAPVDGETGNETEGETPDGTTGEQSPTTPAENVAPTEPSVDEITTDENLPEEETEKISVPEEGTKDEAQEKEETVEPEEKTPAQEETKESLEQEKVVKAPEISAEVQRFLDAVAAIPAITPDNVIEVAEYVYGEVSDAYEALLGTEYEERDDVQAAVAIYAEAIETVETILSIEPTATFADSTTGNSTLIKSAFENAYNLDQSDTCYGIIELGGNGSKTIEDSGTPKVWPTGNWEGSVDVTGYGWVHIYNSNPDVATASYTTEGGKLKITFTPGTAGGTTKISVGVNALYSHYSLETWNMELNFDYTVTNQGNLDLVDPNTAFYNPTEDWFVIDLNPEATNKAWRTDKNGNILTYGNYNGYLYSHMASNGHYVYPSRLFDVKTTIYHYPDEPGKYVADVTPVTVNTSWQEVQYTSQAKGIKFTVDGLSVGKADAVIVGTYDISSYGYYDLKWQHTVHINVIDTSASAKDLSITKTVSNSNPTVGDEFYYTIKLTNPNKEPITGVTVRDVLDGKLSFIEASDDGKYDEGSRTVTWNNLTIPELGNLNLRVKVKAIAAGTIDNTAIATSNGKTFSDTVGIKVKDAPLKITGIEKKLVESTDAAPSGLDVDNITFPNTDGKIVIPNGSSVTLLYKITVTGDKGAAYKVTDDGATHVGGDAMEGNIPDSGKAVEIYVTKTFDATKINSQGKLENTATVTPGKDDKDKTESKVETPAEEEQLYTVIYTDGVGKTLFEDQIHPGNKIDDATPAFKEIDDDKTEIDENGVVKPIREGYTFSGWELTTGDKSHTGWQATVQKKDADSDNQIIYVAQWQDNGKVTIEKTASESRPAVGELFTYTIKVTNSLKTPITVTITDVLDNKLDLVDKQDAETSEEEGKTVLTWENVTVPANNFIEVTVTVKANTAGDIVNTAKAKEDGKEPIDSTVTITAVNTYTVIYQDGVDDETLFEDQSYENRKEGTDTPTFVGTPTREGFTFQGWQLKDTLLTPVGTVHDTVQAVDVNTDGEIIYIAQWVEKTYTVIYTDGVDNETVFADQRYPNQKDGDTTPAFSGTPTREGYTFLGWNPVVKDTVNAGDANANDEIIYTATWSSGGGGDEDPGDPVDPGTPDYPGDPVEPTPTPTPGGGGGGGTTPSPTPTPTPSPAPTTEMPEADVPLASVPVAELPEADVPLANEPEVEMPLVELAEDDVPLADVPKTGDSGLSWLLAMLASMLGLGFLGGKGRKEAK